MYCINGLIWNYFPWFITQRPPPWPSIYCKSWYYLWELWRLETSPVHFLNCPNTTIRVCLLSIEYYWTFTLNILTSSAGCLPSLSFHPSSSSQKKCKSQSISFSHFLLRSVRGRSRERRAVQRDGVRTDKVTLRKRKPRFDRSDDLRIVRPSDDT